MHRGCYGSNLGPTPRHIQIITMHSQDFSNKGRAIKGLVVSCLLLNLISLGVTSFLKIEGEFHTYEVRYLIMKDVELIFVKITHSCMNLGDMTSSYFTIRIFRQTSSHYRSINLKKNKRRTEFQTKRER